MNIVMPQEISDARLDTILRIFEEIQLKQRLTLDFSKTRVILPAGHAILTCLIDKAIENRCQIVLAKVAKDLKALAVFKNLSQFLGQTQFPATDQLTYSSNLLLVRAVNEAIQPSFLDDLDARLQHQTNEEKRWFVRLIFNELMQNALDHSTAERYVMYIGVVDQEVHFGILDLGVTIPAKLEQKYVCKDDGEYLLKSLEAGVGTRRNRPGGLGLNHMFEILKEQEGRLVILSRASQIRKYFKTRKSDVSALKHPLRGTWCLARMPLEK